MKTYFKNKTQSGASTPRILLTSILQASVALLLTAGLLDCSGKNGMFQSGSNGRLQLIPIPVTANYVGDQETGLGLDELGLVSTATNLKVLVTGCATGYTFGTAPAGGTITAVVNLYNGDRTCLIKLQSFDFQGSTYFGYTDGSHEGATAFSTWTNGSIASFSKDTTINSSTPAADLINVFVNTQVSSPVTTSSTIVYNFTDIAAGTTNTLSQSQVSTAVPLTVSGKDAPNYAGANSVTGGVAFARYISTNTDGSGNMSFTLACASVVLDPGSDTNPPFTCTNVDSAGDVQNTQISYALVPDTYNACVSSAPTTLTVANANSIFSGTPVFTGQTFSAVSASKATAGTVASPGTVGQILGGGPDNSGNSGITNGGFCTVPMLTGANPIYSGASANWANGYQYLNDILILKRTDVSSNTLSYLYYCINIAAITQS